MQTRRFSFTDRLLDTADQALRILASGAASDRSAPDVPDRVTVPDERRLAGRLMRVNHAGEVAAQALYQGQALSARSAQLRAAMEHAAREEADHLAWTAARIAELGTHRSYLDPLWYAGSLAIGALAGLAGDKWSLGFVAETEHQVAEHLDGHLQRLPPTDQRSRAILEQMRADELQHATRALQAGGASLPGPIRAAMRLSAKLMTKTAFWI